MNQAKSPMAIFVVLICMGLGGFLILLSFKQHDRAWQIYLVNFLFWSAVAQGGLLFSMIMHVTQARWSRGMSSLSEAFVAFFPVSFALFLILFLGRNHLFPWIGQDLHGKEVWLNVPFLFTRDLVGLLALYGIGSAYVFHALKSKVRIHAAGGFMRMWIERLLGGACDADQCRNRMTRFAIAYMFAYAVVLTLLSFDLVMSMDPHWISTLFGGYFFIKAFYVGLAGLIITASAVYLAYGDNTLLDTAQFHDTGKLFFAFCVVWAYFLYTQVMVIWYGNIPEETHYLIQRFKYSSWKFVFLFAFVSAFMVPFFTLINQRAKTRPVLMLCICSLVLVAIWMENLLLVGPPMHFDTSAIPLKLFDVLISLGFLGLMAACVTYALKLFPELFLKIEEKV